jgi:competence protein ComEC
MFNQRPALRLVLLFAAGIVLSSGAFLPFAVAYCLCVLTACIVLLCLWKFPESIFTAVLLQCGIVLLGCTLNTAQEDQRKLLRLNPRSPNEHILLYGSILSDPAEKNDRAQFLFSADSCVRNAMVEHERRNVSVTLRSREWHEWKKYCTPGSLLCMEATIEQFPSARNPGEFDYGRYLELNDIHGVVTALALSQVQKNPRSNLSTFISSAQRSFYTTLDRLHEKRYSSFLKGIVLGYRADLAEDVKQSFIDTGTIHILAVSGENVAFVALVLFSIFHLLRFHRIAAACSSIAGLVLYMLITGSTASVVRATIMAVVVLLGTCFERKSDIVNSLSIAALLLLLWDTGTLYDVGFQLSFAAVGSILYFYPKLIAFTEKIPERMRKLPFAEEFFALLAVSLAAQIGTLPFTAYYFGKISFVACAANIVVVPISGLNTILGFIEILAAPVSMTLASCYAAVNDCFLGFVLRFVRAAANMPFAYYEVPSLSIAAVVLYYCILAGLCTLRRNNFKYAIIALLLAANVFLFHEIIREQDCPLTICSFDVGQGDAFLLEFPGNRTLLIDSGPANKFIDAGERFIVPYLKRKGIVSLNYAVLTHPHADHYGGILRVAQNVHIDTIVVPLMRSYPVQFQSLLDTLGRLGAGIKYARAGDQLRIGNDERIYVLSPEERHFQERNMNDLSIVMKICFGRNSFLFTGDAGEHVEESLERKYHDLLQSDVLKIGHHGGDMSSSPGFIGKVRPSIALISVGRKNMFGHPSGAVLKELCKQGTTVFRTDRDHATILKSDGIVCREAVWKKE